MDTITIRDLEVRYRVGITEAERATPQRLLLTVEMHQAFANAAASDDLADTIDYFAVSQRLLHFGDETHWQLIETVASDIAAMLRDEFGVEQMSVEVKKFVIPEAQYVSVILRRD